MSFVLPQEAMDAASEEGFTLPEEATGSSSFSLPEEAVKTKIPSLVDDSSFDPASYIAQNPTDSETAVEVAWQRYNKPATLKGAGEAAVGFGKGVYKGVVEGIPSMVRGGIRTGSNIAYGLTHDPEDPERILREAELGAGMNLGFTAAAKLAESAGDKLEKLKPGSLTREEVADNLRKQAAYLSLMEEAKAGAIPTRGGEGNLVQQALYGENPAEPTFSDDPEIAAKQREQFSKNIENISEFAEPLNVPIVGAALAPAKIVSKIAGTGLKTAGRVGEAVHKAGDALLSAKTARMTAPAALAGAVMNPGAVLPAAAAVGTGWVANKLGAGAARMVRESGEEMLGQAFPPRNQSWYRKATKESIKGGAAGTVASLPLMAGAESPEEAGAMLGPAVALGTGLGAGNGILGGRGIDSAAQFGAMVEDGSKVGFETPQEEAVFKSLDPDAQKIVNFWRGYFNGATTPDGNPIQVRALDNDSFQQEVGADTRGAYFKDGRLLINAGETVGGVFRPQTAAQLAEVFSHEGKHALDQALKSTQTELFDDLQKKLRNRFTKDGQAIPEFQEWIEGQKRDIASNYAALGYSPEEIASLMASKDINYFLDEASADLGQALMLGQSVGEFMLPRRLAGKAWDGLKDWASEKGVNIPSFADAQSGALNLPTAQEVARQVRRQLYTQGAEARKRLETREAGEPSPQSAPTPQPTTAPAAPAPLPARVDAKKTLLAANRPDAAALLDGIEGDDLNQLVQEAIKRANAANNTVAPRRPLQETPPVASAAPPAPVKPLSEVRTPPEPPSPYLRPAEQLFGSPLSGMHDLGTPDPNADVFRAPPASAFIPKTEGKPLAADNSDAPLDVSYKRGGPVGSFLDGKEFVAEGSESSVYRQGDTIYKVSEPYNDKSEEGYKARIENALRLDRELGDGTLSHVGHYTSDNGTKNPIFSQPFIKGRAATQAEIDSHMESKGFRKADNGDYRKGTLVAKDLDGDNVKVGEDGGIAVIDASLFDDTPAFMPRSGKAPSQMETDTEVSNFYKEALRTTKAVHRTKNEFDNFDDAKVSGKPYRNYFGKGHYFSLAGDSTIEGNGVSFDNYGKNTKEATLDIRNPFVIYGKVPNKGKGIEYFDRIRSLGDEQVNDLLDSGYVPDREFIQKIGQEKWTNLLKENGYDGVVYHGKDNAREVVAFRADQIKTAQPPAFMPLSESSSKTKMQKSDETAKPLAVTPPSPEAPVQDSPVAGVSDVDAARRDAEALAESEFVKARDFYPEGSKERESVELAKANLNDLIYIRGYQSERANEEGELASHRPAIPLKIATGKNGPYISVFEPDRLTQNITKVLDAANEAGIETPMSGLQAGKLRDAVTNATRDYIWNQNHGYNGAGTRKLKFPGEGYKATEVIEAGEARPLDPDPAKAQQLSDIINMAMGVKLKAGAEAEKAVALNLENQGFNQGSERNQLRQQLADAGAEPVLRSPAISNIKPERATEGFTKERPSRYKGRTPEAFAAGKRPLFEATAAGFMPKGEGQSNLDADVEKNISDAKMMNAADPKAFLRKMADVARTKGNEAAAANFEKAIQALENTSFMPKAKKPLDIEAEVLPSEIDKDRMGRLVREAQAVFARDEANDPTLTNEEYSRAVDLMEEAHAIEERINAASDTLTKEEPAKARQSRPRKVKQTDEQQATDPYTGKPTILKGTRASQADADAAARALESIARTSRRILSEAAGSQGEASKGGLGLFARLGGKEAEAYASILEEIPELSLEDFGLQVKGNSYLTPVSGNLVHVGRGGESHVFRDKETGSVYKFFYPLENGGIGYTVNFEESTMRIIGQGEKTTTKAELAKATLPEVVTKLEAITKIGGIPSEILGFTDTGFLVVKQPLSPDKLSIGFERALAQKMALIERFPADERSTLHDQGWVTTIDGVPHFVTDLSDSNFMRDNSDEVKITDLVIAPIPEEVLEKSPNLRAKAAEIAKKEYQRQPAAFLPKTYEDPQTREKKPLTGAGDSLPAAAKPLAGEELRGEGAGSISGDQQSLVRGDGDKADIRRFVHWSNKATLDALDPSFHGTGINGAERSRKKTYPELYENRIYIGYGPYEKEGNLPQNQHEGEIDFGLLYDIIQDPLDLHDLARNLIKDDYGPDRGAQTTMFEKLVKEHGYLGYRNDTAGVAALFHKVPVTKADRAAFKANAPEYAKRTPEMVNALVRNTPDFAKIKSNYFQPREIDAKQAQIQSEIAANYESLKTDNLSSPRVRKAYESLVDKLKEQYELLRELGISIEPWDKDGQPYANSGELQADLRENKHLYYFRTEPETFGSSANFAKEHPMMQDSGLETDGGEKLLNNDILRAVHDAIAHGAFGVPFGPKGEEAAWRAHMATVNDPWARLALTTETRGQNSVVNFSKRLLHEVIGENKARQLYDERYTRRGSKEKAGDSARGDVSDSQKLSDLRSLERDDVSLLQSEVSELGPLRRAGDNRLGRDADITGVRERDGTTANTRESNRPGEQQRSLREGKRPLDDLLTESQQSGKESKADSQGRDADTDRLGEGDRAEQTYAVGAINKIRVDRQRRAGDSATGEQTPKWDNITLGEHNRFNPKETIFADQKADLLDPEYALTGDPNVDRIMKDSEIFVKNEDARFMPKTDSLGFYSKLEEVVGEKVKGRVTAEQLRKTLKNNGVKDEELEWTLGDLLKRKGDEKITPEELSAEIAANKIELKEVVKGTTSIEAEEAFRKAAKGTVSASYADDLIERLKESRTKQDALDEITENYSILYEEADALANSKPEAAVKFEMHSLPGGKNYRELLFTLPVKAKGSKGWQDWREELLQRTGGDRVKADEVRRYLLAAPESSIDMEAVSEAKMEMGEAWLQGYKKTLLNQGRGAVTETVFKSSHYDEPNIIFHARVNDRTTADGDSMLFMEELQSDAHQAGRKKGYQGDPVKGFEVVVDGIHAMTYATKEEAESHLSRVGDRGAIKEVYTPRNDIDGAIPNLPFKGEGWKRMGLKAILRKAVQEGKDRIGWTLGEQQNERYDLSKQVNSIAYNRGKGEHSELYGLRVEGKNGETIHEKSYKESELEGVVGKEMAQKIINGEGSDSSVELSNGDVLKMKKFSGLDLKIGGTGMIGFYDRELVNIANDLGKKYGARVEKVNIGSNQSFQRWAENNYGTGLTPRGLEMAREEYDKRGFKSVEAWSLPITEPMKAAIGAGQPMFMPKKAASEIDELGFGARFTADAMRQQSIKKKQTAKSDKFPEALPVEYKKINGKFRVDEMGRPQAEPINYDLYETPLAKQAAKGIRGEEKRKEAIAAAYGEKLIAEFEKIKDRPEVMAGKEWYQVARTKIKEHFGDDALLFAQLLGATSARTPVLDNFRQALDAYNQFKEGKYDGIAKKYLELSTQLEDGKLKFRKSFNGHEMGEQVTPKTFRDYLDSEELLPRKSNGSKFNANSYQVLMVLAGVWAEKTGGPKTPNFAGNLSGSSISATIDVWAARTLRRLGCEGLTDSRWRILPESETAVQDDDFFLGQAAYQYAADRIGINPDDAQGCYWFMEKDLYVKRGWTPKNGAGAELSDFNVLLDRTKTEGGKKILELEKSKQLPLSL